MAVQIPADTAIPATLPEAIAPGGDHWEEDVQACVEGEHFLAAYGGRPHVAQCWPAGEIRETGAVYARRLLYRIRPRAGMSEIRIDYRVDSAHGGKLKIDDPGGASFTEAVMAAGDQTGSLRNFGVASPDNWMTLDVYLLATAGAGPYIDLLSLEIYDEDLDAAGLAP